MGIREQMNTRQRTKKNEAYPPPAAPEAIMERRTKNEERRTVSGLPAAFTLIELLVVMVIAVVIMAVSLPSFLSMGRGAGMRTAVNNVRSTVALSRQWAITHREEITFVAKTNEWVYVMTNSTWAPRTNDISCYYATNAEGTLIQSVTKLPLDVAFESSSSNTFKTDGGLASGATPKDIVLVDKKNTSIKTTITINGLTGGIKVE